MTGVYESRIISDETIGMGLFQFEYQLDNDHYAWHHSNDDPAKPENSVHWCEWPGTWARLRFAGTGVRLFGHCGPQMGLASFVLDGQGEIIVDCYASEENTNAVLFQADSLAPGMHDLIIAVKGVSPSDSLAKRVAITGAEVLTDCAEKTASSEKPEKQPIAIEVNDTNPTGVVAQFQYSEEWELHTEQENLYLADAHVCRQKDGRMTVSFSGSQIELYGVKGPDCGRFTAKTDQLPAETADCYAPEKRYHTMLYRSPKLPEGEHVLQITVAGQRDPAATDHLVVVDRVSVLTMTPPVITAVIDSKKTYQQMESFGASSGWTIDPICSSWTEENKNKLADLLYSSEKGIGLSCFRFDLGAGSHISDKERIKDEFWWRATDCFQSSEEAPFSWDNQLGQQWMMRAAKEREVEQYVAYVHSPPFWMTKNGHTQCDPDTGSTNLIPGKEPDFARFLTEVLSRFRDAGLPFDFISPVNECGWVWEYPGVHEEGCRMNRDDIHKVIDALAEELERRNLPEKILGPETETIEHLTKDLDYFAGDPDLIRKLNHCVSAHSYFNDLFEKVGISRRQQLAKELKKYSPLPYWQTEFCFMGCGRGETRDYGITPALWLAKTVYYDLVLLDACAWHWWLSVSPGDFVFKDGLIYTDWRQKGDEENIIASKMLWALGNFSRFVRPGAVRIHLDGLEASDELMATAFRNSDGSIVSIWINCSAGERHIRIDGGHQTSDKCCVYLTDDQSGNDLSLKQELLSEENVLRLPARSVVTVVMPEK